MYGYVNVEDALKNLPRTERIVTVTSRVTSTSTVTLRLCVCARDVVTQNMRIAHSDKRASQTARARRVW